MERVHELSKNECQEMRQKLRNTTLPEFLDGCHFYVQLKINANIDTTVSPVASMTEVHKLIPTNEYDILSPNLIDEIRVRPERIRKWNDFLSQQKTIWDELTQAGFMTGRYFSCLHDLESLGNEILNERKVNWSLSKEIQNYHTDIIGTNLSQIIKQISKNPKLRKIFCLSENGMIYTATRSKVLDPQNVDKEYEVSHTTRTQHPSAESIKATFMRPKFDQFCVYNSAYDELHCILYSSPAMSAFILEYKGAQRLKLEYIRQGLHEMELEEVTRYGKNDSTHEKCTQLVAAIITRTFAYMIQAGLQYGCIWTAEATIFLQIPEDPSTVLYHLSVPKYDVGKATGWSEKPDVDNRLHLTAVGLMLAFTLQSTRTQPRSNSWRLETMRQLKTWNICYENLLYYISDLDDSSSKSPNYPNLSLDSIQASHESPIRFQSQSYPAGRALNDSPGILGNSQHESADELQYTQSNPAIQYCTHKCLHGLKFGGLLDEACPNRKEHGSQFHQISRSEFLELIRRQLVESMNDDFKLFSAPGSKGVPLSIRLISHGYTVLAKCTSECFAPSLLYEAKVYDRLESIQGTYIPVHLGNIDLDQPYLMEGFVMLVHVMFLSYGGTPIYINIPAKKTLAIFQKAIEAFEKIHQLNVLHQDVANRNIMINHVTEQVVVTDFERSKLIEPRPTLVNTSPLQKKRKRSSDSGNEISELKPSATFQERNKSNVSSTRDCNVKNESYKDKFDEEMKVLKQELTDLFYFCT